MSVAREWVGAGSLERLPEILAAHQATRVLLVTGKASFAGSGAQGALDRHLAGIEVRRFCDFRVNPRVEDVRRGVEVLRDCTPDVVVAVGGGSAMDMAKLVNVLGAQAADPLEIVEGGEPIEQGGVPLVAIATTAGSGSEVTHFAVVYSGDTKYSVAHESVRPDYAIVDPRLTHTMTPRLTAACGFDALSQAIESYWAVAATQASQEHAAAAIRLVLRALADAVNRPDPDSRARMAEGAYRAGKAIDVSKTTGAHALSYPLTMHFGVAHGHAVALSLGKFFLFNAEAQDAALNDERGPDHVEAKMRELWALLGRESPGECHDMWYHLMAEVGLETSLEAVGVRSTADRDLVLAGVNPERLGNNPVKVDAASLRTLVESL